MKRPYIQFYVGDWLKDPAVTLCSPSARGIWIDFLCAAHESGSGGVITGSAEQLCRIGRCSHDQLVGAIRELSQTRAADVSERNGTYTLVNRRMKREHDLQRVRASSGAKAIAKRQQNAEVEVEVETESCKWWKEPDFIEVWSNWEAHRVAKKCDLTSIAKLKQVQWLKEVGKQRAIAAINYSILKNWQGIFEEKAQGYSTNGQRNVPPTSNHVWRNNRWVDRKNISPNL